MPCVAQSAWIERARGMALAMERPPYSRDGLMALARSHFPGVRETVLRAAGCGLRLVVVEPVEDRRIRGGVFWVNEGRSPVIVLPLRGRAIGHFWQDLRVQMGRVVRGEGKERPVVASGHRPIRRPTHDIIRGVSAVVLTDGYRQ